LLLRSDPVSSHESGVRYLGPTSAVCQIVGQAGEMHALTRTSIWNRNMDTKPFSREHMSRAAVLLTFCDPLSEQCLRLRDLSGKEWQRLLQWLDVSGLALYLLDRLAELKVSSILPHGVHDRLQQNLRDNAERTRGMIAESLAIQQQFQEAYLAYAVLKGFSLYPCSVPKLELRHQFDLDFLVAEKDLPDARKALERRGYRLYAISGRSWEFKKDEKIGHSMDDFYKDNAGRSVELHVEANTPGLPSVLNRVEGQEFHGISMPVLSSVDLFLGQGLHAYKHVNSEFSRTAHLLEFRRHVLTRQKDDTFWAELRSRAEESPEAALRLGVVTLLITSVMGDFAPEAFTDWTVRRLPPSARLWVKLYGSRTVFGNAPGSKVYLFLQRALESANFSPKSPLRRALLPWRLPPAIVRPSADETLPIRVRRYRMQLHFILLRLRFHCVEGLRYTWESHRWRQHMNRISR
jgi:hypothetical protein